MLQYFLAILTTMGVLVSASLSGQVPQGFVRVDTFIPSLVIEAKYHTAHNFTGHPVPGYDTGHLYLSREAAMALKDVQLELREMGLSLKIFDAYRPQMAVDYFEQWANRPEDSLTKEEYYPTIPKNSLFARGYIANPSGHSRGSAVDVTLVSLETGKEMDMGTSFDFFSPLSAPGSQGVTPAVRANRQLLSRVMEKHGFTPISSEWWHFYLKGEPYPHTYFNFRVR
ncbi:MAG: M15 family metallopeptidase [Owenweeksia sp.]|nr:M15 family metallopeptidase [Owenweeksia sp.]